MGVYKFALVGLMCAAFTACASGPNVAAQRKAHFQRAPQLHASLDTELAKRDPAICDARDAIPEKLAEPLVRIPPIMPPGSVTSGTCKVKFDVSAAGMTSNVRAFECTDELYAYSTRKSVSKWKYAPAILNGKAVGTCNIESRLTFSLMDDRGKMLPIHDVDERGRFKEKSSN